MAGALTPPWSQREQTSGRLVWLPTWRYLEELPQVGNEARVLGL